MKFDEIRPENGEPTNVGIESLKKKRRPRPIPSNRLSTEELDKLFKQAKAGDKNAYDAFFHYNLRFVITIAKKYYREGLDFNDLKQEGAIGLMKAIEKFDPKHGAKFTTYASFWLKAFIGAYAHQASPNGLIGMNYKLLSSAKRIFNKAKELESQLGKKPTMVELTTHLQMSVDEVSFFLTAFNASHRIDYPDSEYVDSEGDRVHKDLPDPKSMDFTQILESDDINSEVQKHLKNIWEAGQLSEREYLMLQLRYGLIDEEEQSLQAIGALMGLSRERIRQILEIAIRKIKASQTLDHLKSIY